MTDTEISQSTSEIAVVAIADAKDGCEADVQAAIRACIAPTRKEDGCLLYTAHADAEVKSRFVFIERWTSHAALAAHTTTPHFLAMARQFATLLKEPLEVLVLDEFN
jgi:quinol monooxygenase YgiN